MQKTSRTALHYCLSHFLKLLEWSGDERTIIESFPHLEEDFSIKSLSSVMKNLNFSCTKLHISVSALDERLFPALFVDSMNNPYVLISKTESHCLVFDGESQHQLTVDCQSLIGDVYVCKQKPLNGTRTHRGSVTISQLIFDRHKALIWNSLFVSFFLNLLTLATPLFVMVVYDRVIGSQSVNMLQQLLMGMTIVLSGVFCLRFIRDQMLNYLSTYADKEIGNEIFQRLLFLSPVYTETASVGSQVSRIRDFDSLREFMSGSLLGVIFELPFIGLGLVVIAMIGGNIVWIPMTMMMLFGVLSYVMNPILNRYSHKSSLDHARKQEFLCETMNKVRDIKSLGAQQIWQKRFREISAKCCLSSLKSTYFSSCNNSISDAIMIFAGIAILMAGVFKTLAGTLSVGALIGVMMIAWRVLAPIKSLFIALPKVLQLKESCRQINQLLAISSENEKGLHRSAQNYRFKGKIQFNQVNLRYPSAITSAVNNANLTIRPGEFVGILGRNGSGKSSLLKMIPGLYQPQVGCVSIDNQDIRQLNPIQLRHSIAYLPQNPDLFYGTIAQNLRLANPMASNDELIDATLRAGILSDINHLIDGFDTRMTEEFKQEVSSSFVQKLCLARVYLKKANIVLLDEPLNTLDAEAVDCFKSALQEMRGKKTIVMICHRPSLLKTADRIIVMQDGRIQIQGPPEHVLMQVHKEMI